MTAVCNESAISGQALRDRCGAPKTTSAKKFSLSIPTEEQMTAWPSAGHMLSDLLYLMVHPLKVRTH